MLCAKKLVLVVCLCGFVFSQSAHAYIDPGSGALVLQMIATAVLGGVFYFRKYLGMLFGVFKKKNSERKALDKDHQGNAK